MGKKVRAKNNSRKGKKWTTQDIITMMDPHLSLMDKQERVKHRHPDEVAKYVSERQWPSRKVGKSKRTGYNMTTVDGVEVPAYRIVAEQMVGRGLRRGETVHHINRDKKDDRPCNLFICSGPRHEAFHHDLDLLMKELLYDGRILLDRESGRYFAVDRIVCV